MAAELVERRKELHDLLRSQGIGRDNHAWDTAWKLLLGGWSGTTQELIDSALALES